MRFSPFGSVPKKDVDSSSDRRLIHDLSPAGESTNEASSRQELPSLRYRQVNTIAARIENLRARFPDATIKMIKGDVSGAFRHIPLAAHATS